MKNEMELRYDKCSRTPVERSFYESFIMSNRWEVIRLYALNMSASRKFRDEVKHLGYQRKTNLLQLDNEIEKAQKQLRRYQMDKERAVYIPRTNQDSARLHIKVIPDGGKQSTGEPSLLAGYNKVVRVESSVGQPNALRKQLYLPKRMEPQLTQTSIDRRHNRKNMKTRLNRKNMETNLKEVPATTYNSLLQDNIASNKATSKKPASKKTASKKTASKKPASRKPASKSSASKPGSVPCNVMVNTPILLPPTLCPSAHFPSENKFTPTHSVTMTTARKKYTSSRGYSRFGDHTLNLKEPGHGRTISTDTCHDRFDTVHLQIIQKELIPIPPKGEVESCSPRTTNIFKEISESICESGIAAAELESKRIQSISLLLKDDAKKINKSTGDVSQAIYKYKHDHPQAIYKYKHDHPQAIYKYKHDHPQAIYKYKHDHPQASNKDGKDHLRANNEGRKDNFQEIKKDGKNYPRAINEDRNEHPRATNRDRNEDP